MKRLLLTLLLLGTMRLIGQNYIDTLYTVADTTVSYGTAVDFAGNVRDLTMDISWPTNAPVQASGHPLMLVIHGGAFLAGSKDEASISNMRHQFAQRGYVTAAINYRLGWFQTSSSWNCNISWIFNQPWNCMNASDTTEWTRGYYRGIQDAHGAIRYMVNHSADYDIDPMRVFLVGESAGAFIAMGVGYMDDNSEMPAGVGARPNAPAPNAIYENQCIIGAGLDTNIASMALARPDLGPITGTLNLPSAPYRIAGVGDMYGGTFGDLWATNANDADIPILYIFHQPADLIVPYTQQRVLHGYAYCTTQWPFNCAWLLNRPVVYGGNTIKAMIDAHALAGDSVPLVQAEFTNNNADCATQINNPSLGGHQYDSYWTRTYNMAVFFAQNGMTVSRPEPYSLQFTVAPNPSRGQFRVTMPAGVQLSALTVQNLLGQVVYTAQAAGSQAEITLPPRIAAGTYLLQVETTSGRAVRRIVVE